MAGMPAFHCLAPDLPGFGRSDRFAWSMVATADRIAELIEHDVPEKKASLVGLSVGGGVAHTLLARRPRCSHRPVWDQPASRASSARARS
jgi:pimeloyl-ACP methyl ester carboxylesterase